MAKATNPIVVSYDNFIEEMIKSGKELLRGKKTRFNALKKFFIAETRAKTFADLDQEFRDFTEDLREIFSPRGNERTWVEHLLEVEVLTVFLAELNNRYFCSWTIECFNEAREDIAYCLTNSIGNDMVIKHIQSLMRDLKKNGIPYADQVLGYFPSKKDLSIDRRYTEWGIPGYAEQYSEAEEYYARCIDHDIAEAERRLEEEDNDWD